MSHPSRVRELKLHPNGGMTTDGRSHPSRVRELKRDAQIRRRLPSQVAPLPGA